MGKKYLVQFMIIIDITDLKDKCQLFNCFFLEQCNYGKILVLCPIHVSNKLITFQIPLFFQKNIYISIYILYIYIYIIYIYIYIYQIIKNLDPNKAHGHDMISIRMIKLCGISICKPLNKFSNVISTFKKDDKQCIKIIVHLMTVMK